MLKFSTPAFAVVFTLLILLGCEENEGPRASVGFITTALKASEESPSTVLSFYLDRAATEDLIIDLKFSGTATRGKDYECPRQLTILKGLKSANLTMTLLDDGEYERTEETIIVTIATLSSSNFIIGKQNTATAIVAFDATPHLEIKLEWKAEEESSEVDMNLILFKLDDQGAFLRASDIQGPQFEQLNIPGSEVDATFGLSYQYFAGNCRALYFKVALKCYNCNLNGSPKPLSFSGTYTNSNLNPTRTVHITQKFVKKGFDYQFSTLSIPSNGSRGILPE